MTKEAIWRDKYKQLTAYHQEHGHCTVTQKENPALARWLQNQRKQRTRLAPERVALLDRLGFRWKQRKHGTIANTNHWDQMYERLRAFQQTHGHCTVNDTPATSTSVEQQQLHRWMSKQRREQASLSQQRIAKLSSLGFNWETPSQRLERKWNEGFDRLKAYKARTGDCNVPTQKGGYTQDPALATWVSSQRQTRGTLTPFQKGKLDGIGFVWCCGSNDDNKWDAMYAKLVDFHAQHGHADVPLRKNSAVQAAHYTLAQWVKKQRNYGRTGKLAETRVAKLDQLAFVWLRRTERNESTWMHMLARLKRYKLEHGDCLVPAKYYTDRKLGNWVIVQRRRHKLDTLPPNRVEQLQNVDFVWALREVSDMDITRVGSTPSEKQAHRTITNPTVRGTLRWDDVYERLRAFHQTHGHCNVSVQSSEEQQLQGWMSRQRRDRASLSQEQVTKLGSLDFRWETISQGLERKWNELFERLKAYKARTGDCNVPTQKGSYTQDPALATWVSSQRQTRNKLPPIQKGKLDEIGFVWGCDSNGNNHWDAMYAKLVDFHAHHGHTDVPHRYDQALGQWATKQRKGGRTGKLPENRVAKLDQLTFVWETRSERNETSWMELFERLKQYQLEHGDCFVPTCYIHRKLYNWVIVQRRRYKDDKLPQHRVEKLHSVGFVFGAIDTGPVDDQWIEF